MIRIFTILLLIGFFIFIRNKKKEEFITVPQDDKFIQSRSMKVGMLPRITPIDKQFLKEQEYGANMNILYPNTWVECVDSDGTGVPKWNSREKTTGEANNIILPRVLNSYNFNKERILNMGGVIDPGVNLNVGEKIKDIYDNSFVNFKNLIPNKTIISDTFPVGPGMTKGISPEIQLVQGASNLSYLTPDTWIYENEKGENGGVMYTNKHTTVFASDPTTEGIVASF